MNDFICDLRSHGNRQLELKTHYPVRAEPKLRYDLDLYLFTPGQLQIDERRYGVERFLGDLKVNTRYSTPGIPLARLVDPTFELSPLARIESILERVGTVGTEVEDDLLYEIRTLVNVYRVELRSMRELVRFEQANGTAPEILCERLDAHAEQVATFLRQFRKSVKRFVDPHVSDYLRTAISWADESISLATEIERFKLYSFLRRREELRPAVDRLKPLLAEEAEYRRRAGFASVVKPGDAKGNENLLYREGMLKKWSQAVMYLGTERSRSAAQVSHVLAAIAAAAAMSFAVAATVLAERLFASYSVPWALLIVISYIFKDRIKEVLRGILLRLIPGLVADDAGLLSDPASKRRVGRTKSVVRFCRPSELPTRVVDIRNAYPRPFKSILPEENVIHYRRRIRLDGRKLHAGHTRLDSITEILRIKLDEWLEEMDEPVNNLAYVDGKKVRKVPAARVYHVNVIVSLAQNGTQSLFHFRVVLTREGLRRIETVATSRAESRERA